MHLISFFLIITLSITLIHSKHQAEACHFKCPIGLEKKANPEHIPSSNGCGSEFPVPNDLSQAAKLVNLFSNKGQNDQLQSIAPVDIESCCDTHDICYSTCNEDKQVCDDNFHVCMKSKCPKNNSWQCEKIASMYHTVVGGWGCEAYQKAQQDACLCVEN